MPRHQKVQPKATEPRAFTHKRGQHPTIITPANDPPSAALTLTLNGQVIRDRGEMLSLTDMWKAAGSDPSKRPADWSRKEGASFIDHMNAVLNVPQGHILAGERGRTGQTFGHWQIALAYAKYLSPTFHAACNVVIRERMEGRQVIHTDFDGILTGLDPAVARQIGGIIKGVVHNQLSVVLPQMLQAEIIANQYVGVRGLTAGEVLDMAGFLNRKGLRGLSGFVSGRLRRFHSEKGVASPIATLGRSTAYVFDRALSREWLDTGGRQGVEMKIAEKRGQTVMKLVRK